MTTQNKDTREENKDNTKNDNASHEKGKQGFASMPKEKVQEIAAEGGRHSHDKDDNRSSSSSKNNNK